MAEEKKKLSWREIDKLKDRSGFAKVRSKMEREERFKANRAQESAKKEYLKELEKLFQNKKDHEREEALKKLSQHIGKREFKKMALEFLEKFGLPLDVLALLLFLDSKDKELILRVLEFVKNNLSQFSSEDLQILGHRFKSLRYTLTDPKVLFQIENLLKEIGS